LVTNKSLQNQWNFNDFTKKLDNDVWVFIRFFKAARAFRFFIKTFLSKNFENY